jgi:hypothetical protein
MESIGSGEYQVICAAEPRPCGYRSGTSATPLGAVVIHNRISVAVAMANERGPFVPVSRIVELRNKFRASADAILKAGDPFVSGLQSGFVDALNSLIVSVVSTADRGATKDKTIPADPR